MKKIVFLFFIVFISCEMIYSQETPKNIINKSCHFLEERKSIEYKLLYKMKLLNNNDTLNYSSSVFLSKKNGDTILKGMAWFSMGDTAYTLYDLRHTYFVNNKQKSVTIYTGEAGIFEDFIWSFFLNSEKLGKLANDDNSFKILKDTTIDGALCYQIHIAQPDENDITDRNQFLYINKQNFVPVLQRRSVKFQGNIQYSEFYIKTYSFDHVDLSRFSKNKIPSSYKRIRYKQPEPPTFLKIGTKAPIITGKNYSNGLKKESLPTNGKITLLDFWFMGCMPCIQAIPVIEHLKEIYDSSVFQIYGINNFDNNQESIDKVGNFIKYNKMGYPIIFVDKPIINEYQISVWPTFYIIDANGKISHAQFGISDSLFQELNPEIEKAIKLKKNKPNG